MTRTFLIWCVLTVTAAGADPGALFGEAENLSRSKRKAEAMAKVEEAVAEIDRALAAGEDVSWHGMNGLRFAANLAREDFLDFEKALSFSDKQFEIADTDYWRTPARLERALTYRAMGKFDKAQREYDAIAQGDERHRTSGIMPQAQMVYFDMGETARGRQLLTAAMMNEDINGNERFGTLRKCAQAAVAEGCRDDAVGWYALTEKMPFGKETDRARFLTQAWYEMGQLEESRGNTSQAKGLYRRAMQLEDGDMRYRTRARDALEGIGYFE